MDTFVKKEKWSDNALENYFLELLIEKKVIDREIQEVLDVVEKSPLHHDYKSLLKIILFGHENLYFQNWGTLQDGLMDVIKVGEIRANTHEEHGIIIDIILWLVEEIFDIPDEHMHSFVILEDREDVEHSLIILMKRMLDHLEVGLTELISQSPHLSKPIEEQPHSEYILFEKNLHSLPHVFMETEKERIAALKNSVHELHKNFVLKKDVWEGSIFSEL